MPDAKNQPALATPPPPSRSGLIFALVLAGLILLPQLLRASTEFNPLPYWDSDPLTFVPTLMGLTPGTSLLLDAVVIIASAVAVAAGWWPRGWLLSVLATGAAIAIAYWVLNGTQADSRLAGAWGSGATGAVALSGLCRDRTVRAVCSALVLGFAGLMLAKGAMQWFVEHPDAVESFKRNRGIILASNGWEEGSSMARAYERRLLQREASGWFGLANVYASFAAAFSVALMVLTVGVWRKGGAARVVIALGFACAAGSLYFAGSKGGVIAAGVGGMVVLTLLWLRGRRWAGAGGWLGPALCALVMAAVVVRGLVGERIGELSLLFRWFYWQAAAKILTKGPTGPGGFQDAYLLNKPAISPEEVQSAHNALMDWTATMWWPGLLLAAIFMLLLYRAGRGAVWPASQPAEHDSAFAAAASTRAVLLGGAALVLAGVFLDRQLLTENTTVVRLGGMALFIVIGLGVLHAARRSPAWAAMAMSAAAISLAAHGMIEVTGTNQQAAGLWWSVMAIAAGAGLAGSRGGVRPLFKFAGLAALVLMGQVVVVRAHRSLGIEALLREAAQQCRPVAEVNNLLTAARGQTDALRRQEFALRAMEIVKVNVPAGTPMQQAEGIMRLAAADRAIPLLDKAAELSRHWPIARESQRLQLMRLSLPMTTERAQAAERIVRAAEREALGSRQTTVWSWLATVYAATESYGIRPGESMIHPHTPVDRRTLPRMIEGALIRAQQLDPYNPMHAQRQLKLAQEQGWVDEIQGRAQELLALDDLQRLDRTTRGLPDAERRRVEALARRQGSPPP